MIKHCISKLMLSTLGPRNYYRLSRYMWMDARRDVHNQMETNGEYELIKAIVASAKKSNGPVFLDIGCNVGEYSKLLLDTLTQSKFEDISLYCFEPNPDCRLKIRKRLETHALWSKVKVIESVITDRIGKDTFFITGATAGSSSLQIDTATQTGQKLDVDCLTLDKFCQNHEINEVFFAKVDTEGNDMRVLEGAKNLLREGKIHYLQFEYNHRWILFRNYLKDVFNLIEPLGYKVSKVTSSGLEVYSRWHFDLEVFREGNYLIARDLDALKMKQFKPAIEM